MFVWSFRFCSRRRTLGRTIRYPPRRRRFGNASAVGRIRSPRFPRHGLIKGWNHHVDFTRKAFERAHGRAMLGRLDWGIPPVAHQVGCKAKRYRFDFRFGTRTMPLSGTYGGQGKAAGSSDLPAALLSVQFASATRGFGR
jgi:hypothetical protein